MKVLVYGAGRVGVVAIYDLIKYCGAQTVWVREPAEEARRKAHARLRVLLGPQVDDCVTFWHAPNNILVPDCTETMDCIISCAPYSANYDITRTAIAAGVPMVDLGGNPEMVKKQEDMAKDVDSLVVSECGISPGISNMLAAYLSLQGYTDIKVRCGGILLEKTNFLNYKFVFSLEGLLSEYYGNVPTIQDGKLRMVVARSTVEDFRGLAASPTSNNSPQVVQNFIDMGVLNYDYMTLRHPGHWDKWSQLEDLYSGDMTAFLTDLNNNKRLQYDRWEDRDKIILSVEGQKGSDQLKECAEYYLEIFADKKTKLSAMEMTTAWGATIVAKYIVEYQEGLNNARMVGFTTPEMFVPRKYLLKELGKRVKDLNQ